MASRIFLFLTLIFNALAATAQTLNIRGEVTDARTGDKIEAATILHLPGGKGFSSGKDGSFKIQLSGSGGSLVISATGYLSDTVRLTKSTGFINASLRAANNSMEEVVVSGSLREVVRSQSPIPVETYSSKFLRKNISPTLFESLGFINGVQPQLNCNVCNTGDIHINGMEGPYTMVLIDGMPIVSNLASVYGFSGIPSSLIKRVEVVKGPASTLYGSEAVAGLINIITKDPASAPKFSADMQVTSYRELNGDLAGKISVGKAQMILGINGFFFDRKYDINHDNFTDVTLQKRFSIFNKWTIERASKRQMNIAARYVTEDRWGGELNWSKRWRGTDSIYGENIITRRFELIGNYGLNIPGQNIMFDYSYNYHHQDSYYGASPYLAAQHTTFTQLRWEKTSGSHNLMAGIPVRYTWYDDNTPATQKPGTLETNPSKNITSALFLQDEYAATKSLTILGGIRLEHSNLQGSILSPRVAFRYKKANNIFRFSAGNGFRVVNLFTEDHLALSGARELIITEELKPEKSWNGTFNYNGSFVTGDGFLNLDASLFCTYFTNKIVPDYDTDPQKIIYSNLDGYAVSRGLTLNAELSTAKNLRMNTGVTIMDVFRVDTKGIQKKKEQQLFAPTFSATYAVTYSIPQWKLVIDFTGKIYGPERLPVVPNDFRPDYSPWFTLANLQFTKKIAEGFELYASLKNLFNFIPKNPILRPFDPFDKTVNDPVNNPNNYTFDPSYNYAPIQGTRVMTGIRYQL